MRICDLREKGKRSHLKRDSKAPNPGTGASVSKRRLCGRELQALAGPHVSPSCMCTEFHFEGSHEPPFSSLPDRPQQRPSKTKGQCSELDLTLCVGRRPVSLRLLPDSLSTSASLCLHICIFAFILYLQFLCEFAGFSVLFSVVVFFNSVFQCFSGLSNLSCLPLEIRSFSSGRMF